MPNTIVNWDPFGELGELRSRLDRMFADFGDGRRGSWMPAVDVVRDNGKLLVRVDVPGIKPEEVKIEVEDEILTVSGEHTETSKTEEEHYVRRERRTGSFSRSITLPAGVDAKRIKAHTKDGVVEITVPLPTGDRHAKVEITPTAG